MGVDEGALPTSRGTGNDQDVMLAETDGAQADVACRERRRVLVKPAKRRVFHLRHQRRDGPVAQGVPVRRPEADADTRKRGRDEADTVEPACRIAPVQPEPGSHQIPRRAGQRVSGGAQPGTA